MSSNRRVFIATFVGLTLLAGGLPALAASPKTEEQLVQDLSSPKESVVMDAIQHLEKQYPTGTLGIPAVKKLLSDPRPKVKRKAARSLGALHADLDEAELKSIAALLDSKEKDEVLDGLKALRGLKAQSVVPKIIPLLSNPDKNIMRDSCRTLAAIGDKSVIPSIEPLLKHPDAAVQKDAQDAIYALKQK